MAASAALSAVALVQLTGSPAAAAPVTVTFTAGADQPFTVPSGVSELAIVATGASGGSVTNGGAGGAGATVTGTVPVSAGQTLYVNVDVGGGSPGSGNGGAVPGGNGGGASDVRTCSSAALGCALTGTTTTDPRIIVAGGGGGGGYGTLALRNSESAGGAAGDTGGAGGSRLNSGGAGGGGTPNTFGTGGAACPASGSSSGLDGGAGVGGAGGGPFGGGGGGAGWFGGGGGGGCNLLLPNASGPGGGGGGSNFVPSGGGSGAASGPAQVTITYERLFSVTVNQALTQADPTKTGTLYFNVHFSEPIDATTFTNGDVTLGGTAAGASVVGIIPDAGSPNPAQDFDVQVSGMTSDGTVAASIASGKVSNLSGDKVNGASTSTDNTVTYDTTAPSVTTNQAAGQADPTTIASVKFAIGFSETIQGGGLTNADVALGGTAGATTVNLADDPAGTVGKDYLATVTGMTGPGTVTASIAAGAVADLAGNQNTASTSTDNTVTYQVQFTSGPTATISGVARQGQTLTANEGSPSPAPDSFSYRWFADGVQIPAQGGKSLTLTSAQVGRRITVTVTASKAGYNNASSTSAPTAKVQGIFVPGSVAVDHGRATGGFGVERTDRVAVSGTCGGHISLVRRWGADLRGDGSDVAVDICPGQ